MTSCDPAAVIAVTRLRSRVVPALAVALLATSLVLLWAGHFFSYDDVEGVQSRHWNYVLGDVAGLVAVVGVLVSLSERTARRLAGAVVAAFVGFLAVAGLIAAHLTFVGSNDAFGRAVWEVLLGIVAFVLLTPRWVRVRAAYEPGRRRRVLTTWARCGLYLLALVPATPAIFLVGISLAAIGHPECGDTGDACLQEYAGAFYGLAAIALLVAGLVVLEIVRAVVRWSRRVRAA